MGPWNHSEAASLEQPLPKAPTTDKSFISPCTSDIINNVVDSIYQVIFQVLIRLNQTERCFQRIGMKLVLNLMKVVLPKEWNSRNGRFDFTTRSACGSWALANSCWRASRFTQNVMRAWTRALLHLKSDLERTEQMLRTRKTDTGIDWRIDSAVGFISQTGSCSRSKPSLPRHRNAHVPQLPAEQKNGLKDRRVFQHLWSLWLARLLTFKLGKESMVSSFIKQSHYASTQSLCNIVVSLKDTATANILSPPNVNPFFAEICQILVDKVVHVK